MRRRPPCLQAEARSHDAVLGEADLDAWGGRLVCHPLSPCAALEAHDHASPKRSIARTDPVVGLADGTWNSAGLLCVRRFSGRCGLFLSAVGGLARRGGL